MLASIANIVTWEFVGYNMLIFYSALRTVPDELYEAAAIDGAGPFRTSSIKLPALRGAIVIATIFSIIGSFQLFNEPNILRTLAPNVIDDLLHAEHVRLQPLLRRAAVQLLGHRRDRDGRHHRGHRVRRAAARLPQGGDVSTLLDAAEVAVADRVDGPLPRATRWCRCSGCCSARPRPRQTCSRRPGLWFGDHFALFSNIKETLTYHDGIFLRWLGNTLLYVVAGAGGATLLATAAGYGLAKFNFAGRRAVFAVLLGAVAVPGTALAVPTFLHVLARWA